MVTSQCRGYAQKMIPPRSRLCPNAQVVLQCHGYALMPHGYSQLSYHSVMATPQCQGYPQVSWLRLRNGDQCREDQANNTSGINTEIKVNGQKLETVTSFKYMGSVISDEGSKPEILSRIAQTTAALTRLKPIWIDKSISLSSKI